MKKGNLLNRFKRFSRINRLFLILAAVIAGSGNVWGSSYDATLHAYANPSGKGYVYVGTDNSYTGTPSLDDDGATKSVKEGDAATFYLYAQSATGYSFTNWTGRDGTSYSSTIRYGATFSQTMPGSKTTWNVNANFTANQYSVSFNNNGGSGTVPSTVTATFDAAMPTISSFTAPTKNGYDFGGYSDATSGGTKYYNANGTSAKNWDKDQNNATLYAIWTGKQYAVTLSANGGSGGTSVSATYGSAMPSASAPTRNGFTFLGYYDGNGTQYYNASMASVRNWDKTAATTLYAQWSAYQVNYNLNYEGANQTNYFTGWTETVTSSGLTLAYDPATGFITINGTSTSSAGPIIQEMPGIAAGEVISYAATDYAGTRSSANGCQVFETCNFYGTAASSPRQNLDFRGNTSKTNQTVQSGFNNMKFWIWYNTEAVTYTNLKFKLRLEKASSLASIAAPSGKYVVKGQAYGTLANDPVRDGYYFEGWYTAAEGGTKVESTTIFNGTVNQVLYAHWSEVKTYILGDVTSKTTHTGGQIYISSGGVTDITKVPEASWTQHDFGGPNTGKSHKYYLFARPFTGYSFTKWTAEDGTQLSTSTTFTPTVTNNPEDKVLQKTVQYYAIFTIHSWTLTWAGIDGATVSGGTPAGPTNYGTALTAPTVSKAGWKFTGWNPTVPATMPDANATYTAQWSAVTVEAAKAQTVNFTEHKSAGYETQTATLTFSVTNASAKGDFNEPSITANTGWSITGWNYSEDKVTVNLSFTATENTTTNGNHEATVTLKAKSNNQATGKVTASVDITPAFTNNIASTYLVDDAAINLNTLWTSTSNGTKTYSIVSWNPSGINNQGATPPAIDGNNNLSLGQAGSLTLQLSQGKGTSTSTGTQKTCSLTINKRDNAITTTYAGTMYMGATQNVTVSATNTATAITFTQTAGSDIATLNSAKTQVTSYAKLGTATWNFAQAENYKYKAANASMSINVVKAAETECVAYNIGKVSISGGEHDEVHDMVNSEKITFTTRIGSGSVSNVFWVDLYINNAWVNIFETSSEQAWTLTDSRIKSATKVRFSAKGSINKYFDDVVIYRHKYIAPTESITIDKKANNEPIYIGESGTGTMTVKWSICNGGTLKLSSSNPKFTLSQTTITEATDGTGGTKDITITYSSPDAGTDNATIVVYNDAHRAETQVTGVTVKKTPSMSWWNTTSPLTLSTLDGPIYNPVIDITEGCDYTMTVSQEGYVTLDNVNKVITPVNPTPADTYITLTATIDNHDYYGQITKQIAVTNLMSQEITWNQNFYNLKATSPATTMQLNATAQTTVSYESSDPTVVSVNGTTLTILKKGTCYLTAIAAEAGGYAKAEMQKQVIVRNEGESCEPTELFGTYKVSDDNDAWIPAPFPSKKFEMQVIRGDAISSRNMWVYARDANGNETELDKFNPPAEASGYNKSYDIASNVTYIRLHSDANNNMKVREGRWTMAQTMSVSPTTINFECTTTESKTNTFTATYSNIQGPLVYTSTNPYITFNPLSNTQGDCGDMGSKTITITYAPAEVQDADYTITVWDGTTASMKRDITVHCKSTAATQSMSWTQDFSAAKKTTDLITFDATTDAVRTEENTYPVVYTSSNTSVATIDGNKLVILSSGTVTITASQDGKDANGRQRYNAVQMQKTITLEKVTPTIVTLPTVGAVKYGEKYSTYTLTGGSAETTYQGTAHTAVAGSFVWTTPDAQITTKDGLSVTFKPTSSGLYNDVTTTINASSISNVVTFEAEGGTVSPTSKEVTYNSTYGDLPVPTRENYRFDGWYTDATGGTKVTKNTTVTTMENHALHAHWTGLYNISFNANGGSGSMSNITVTMDSVVTFPTNGFTAPTYTLTYELAGGTGKTSDVPTMQYTGWEDHGSITYSGVTYNYTEFDAAYYGTKNADVMYSITNWKYDKYLLVEHYVYHGIPEKRPGTSKPMGTYMARNITWESETRYVTQFSRLTTTVGATVPLYAQWQGEVTLPTPTRDNYQFIGWYDGDSLAGAGGDTYQLMSNKTLTAHWEANDYTVKFNGNGNTGGTAMADVVYKYSTQYNLPANTYTKQYTIKYTNTGTSGAIDDKVVDAPFNGWEDHSTTEYEGTEWPYTTFDAALYGTNGPDVVNSSEYGKGAFDKFGLIDHFVKHGYNEWQGGAESRRPVNTDGTFGAYPDQAKVAKLTNLAAPVQLYAQWGGATITLPNASKTGYDLLGWYRANEEKAGDAGATYIAKENETLTTKWTASTYTLTFDVNLTGATVDPASKTVTYDAAYGTLPTPVEGSHQFDGWYTLADGGEKVTAATVCKVAGDHSIYAHWTQMYYSRCEANATDIAGCTGVYVTNQPQTTYGSITNWPHPTDQTQHAVGMTTTDGHVYYFFARPGTGYTHTGWSESKGGAVISGSAPDADTRWVFNGTVTSKTTTSENPQWFIYYPVMTPNQYKVTFDKQSGTGGSNDVMATYDADMPSGLTAPTRDGYTFAGYYDAVSGGTQYYTAAMASAHIWNKAEATTLYARWTANQYTVTLDPNYTGAATKTVTATYGSAMPSMGAVPTRTGHKFLGYYDAKDGGTQYYNESGASVHAYDKTSGCTLYAHWIGADFFTWNNGEALTFEALTTIPNNVAVAFSGHNVTYTSGNSSIVKVEADGLHALKAGTVSITATTAEDPSGYFAQISETKTFTITKVKQSIVWDQNFAGLQTGDEPVTLTAYAVDTLGDPTGANISYAVANTSVAKVENGQIVVVGKGETTITATATSEIYRDTTKTLKVVVRSTGEPCNTTVYDLTNETARLGMGFIGGTTTRTVNLKNVPYCSLKLQVSRSTLVSSGALSVSGMSGSTSVPIVTFDANNTTTSLKDTTITIDNKVLSSITFTCTANLYYTISNIEVKQASYLEARQTKDENAKLENIVMPHTINTQYDTTFVLIYSDKPVISARITNHYGLKLTRTEPEEMGGCGAAGKYHFKVSSTEKWTDPCTIRDTIFIVDGMKPDSFAIPITLTVDAGDQYYFLNTTGDYQWNTLGNWQVKGEVPKVLPSAINPVTIKDTAVITKPVEVYDVTIDKDSYNKKFGYLTIEPTGGLTIYRWVYDQELTNHLKIKSSIQNTGFFRLAPKGIARWDTKPTITMQYATKATLDNGANKDAKWQYFGIPVDNYDFTVDYITWLNEWDETNPKGWIKHNNESKPVNMKAFKGYEITQYGQPVYEFTGAIRMDSVTLTLTNTSSGKHGDNIIANSFPAPIDVTLFKDDDFSEGVEKTFYIYNSGSWNQWKQHQDSNTWQSDAPGAFTAIPIKSAELMGTEVQTLIPPMQAICMWTEEEGTVKLNYAKHVWYATTHSSKDDMNAGLRAPSRAADEEEMTPEEIEVAREKAIRDSLARASKEREKELTHRVRITVTSENSGADHLYLLEKDGFVPEFENGYDAYKMWASNSSYLNIYSKVEDDELMSVFASDELIGTYVGIDAGDDETYCLKVSSVIGDSLCLKDLTNNVEIDITEGQTYMFNAEAGSINEERFIIKKREPTTPTQVVEQSASSNAYIWTDAHYLHIENAGVNSPVMLYAADGKLIYNEMICRSAVISIDQLITGVYLVYVDGKPMKFVKK